MITDHVKILKKAVLAYLQLLKSTEKSENYVTP